MAAALAVPLRRVVRVSSAVATCRTAAVRDPANGSSDLAASMPKMSVCIRARLLLHWVNSLPPTKCLLVDDLVDLRFGDVLADIIAWIQSQRRSHWGERIERQDNDGSIDFTEGGLIARRVRAVVQFAASESRSVDGDAAVVVNSADCVALVMEGDYAAIAAVLEVLKRLSSCSPPERQRTESLATKASFHSRGQQAALIERAQSMHTAIVENAPMTQPGRPVKSEPFRSNDKSRSTSRAATADATTTGKRPRPANKPAKHTPKPRTTPNSAAKCAIVRAGAQYQDSQGLHVFGMLDPVAKPKVQKQTERYKDGYCDDLVTRVCLWVDVEFGIDLPMKRFLRKETQGSNHMSQTHELFNDGVLLSRIAAEVLRRVCRDEEIVAKVDAADSTPHSSKVSPNQSRRNILVARDLFERLGVSDSSLRAVDRLRGGKPLQDDAVLIWKALDELRLNVAPRILYGQGAHHICNSRRQDEAAINKDSKAPKRIEGPLKDKRSAPRRISARQTKLVEEWVASLGLNTHSAAQGVLQDTMRNGVLLCALCLQEFPGRGALSYYKTPRSLAEVRENIRTALRYLADILRNSGCANNNGEDCVEDILRGDQSLLYEILWHLRKLRVSGETHQDHKQQITSNPDCWSCEHQEDSPSSERSNHLAAFCSDQTPFTPDISAIDSASNHTVSGNILWGSEINEDDDLFPVRQQSSPATVVPVPQSEVTSSTKETPQSESAGCCCRSDVPQSIEYSPSDQDTKPTLSSISPSRRVADTIGFSDQPARALESLKRKLQRKHQGRGIQAVKTADSLAKDCVEPIISWLRLLNVRLKNPAALRDPLTKLTEFQSGIVLCEIVERVEFMRGIPGVVSKEGHLSKASALHNINKALSILQSKKTMPLHLLRRARSIYQGDRAAILQLLMHIRRAYGHHATLRGRAKREDEPTQTSPVTCSRIGQSSRNQERSADTPDESASANQPQLTQSDGGAGIGLVATKS